MPEINEASFTGVWDTGTTRLFQSPTKMPIKEVEDAKTSEKTKTRSDRSQHSGECLDRIGMEKKAPQSGP